MVPPIVSIYCGCGGVIQGFKQSGHTIIGACDTNMDAIFNFSNNFHTTRQKFMFPSLTSDKAIVKLKYEFMTLRQNFILVITPPRSIDGIDTSKFIRELKPIVSVTIVSTDVVTDNEGIWMTEYKRDLKDYDTMMISVDMVDYGSPFHRKRTLIISFQANRLGKFGTPKERQDLMTNIGVRMFQSRVPQHVGPRHMLNKFDNTFASCTKTHVFLTPRGPFDQAIFPIDEPLPPLRNTCVRVRPPNDYTPRQTDPDGVALDQCLFLSHDMLASLMCLPNTYVTNTNFSATTQLYLNTLPPYFTQCIASVLFDVNITNRPKDGEIESLFVTVSEQYNKLELSTPKDEFSERDKLFHRKSRMHKLVTGTSNAHIQYFIGRNNSRRRMVSYMYGSDETGDEITKTMLNDAPIKTGWTIELKERQQHVHAYDDIYYVSPIGSRIRSRKQFLKLLENKK